MTTITLDKQPLVKALGHLTRVIERRNTIPMLSNVLLATDGADGLVMTGTDLDIEVRTRVAAEASGDAHSITVGAAILHDIVRKVADKQPITLGWEPEGTKVTLKAGRSRFTLQALPATDFPNLAAGEFPHTFTLPAATLANLITHTEFAISSEETRYYLNGIYLHAAETDGVPVLRAVATDGHRLALDETPLPEGAVGMPGIIVPRKTVGEIARIAKEIGGDVILSISAGKIRVQAGETTLTSKVIDGTFPDYARVIPTRNDKRAAMPRETLAYAADRVSAISSERGRAIKLAFTADALALSVNNPDAGSAEDRIEADYSSADLEIGFNARYLLDVLASLGGEDLTMDLSEAGSPTLFRNPAQPARLVVLMPMRV